MFLTDGPFAGLREHHYQVILADPPWNFQVRSPKGEGRSAKQHYETMTRDEIGALPVRRLAASNAVLFLWTTDTHLQQALHLIGLWGFEFKTVGFYWTKTNQDGSPFCGMGFWTRANPEQCLLATTGQPKRISKDVRRLIQAPRREHSRKPDAIYDGIEALIDGPYVELFARQRRPGWAAWGEEADKYTYADDVEALL